VAGSRRTRSWAIALISAAALALLPAAAAAVDSVLWSNPSVHLLSSAALNGSGGLDLPFDAGFPEGEAIDTATGRVYWVDVGGTAPAIRFASLDGGPVGTLDTGNADLGAPRGLAIDPAAQRIYWADSTNKIGFASLDPAHPGGDDLPTGAATLAGPVGVAVDPAAGRIYWANASGNKISFANLNGTGGGDIPTGRATVNTPQGVAVDPSAKRIYWTNSIVSAGMISFASLDPDTPGGGDVFTGYKATLGVPFGIAIDPVGGRLYWVNEQGQHQVSFTSLDDNGTDDDLNIAGTSAVLPAPSSGARFPVVLASPQAAAPPVIAGSAAVAATLSCSQGKWAPDVLPALYYRAPQRFAFQWSRDGVDIPGATQSTLTAGTSGDYRCRVTATNHAGSTAQTSDAHHVAAPVTPPPPVVAAFGPATRVTLRLATGHAGPRGPVQLRIANANGFAVAATLSARTSKPVAGAHGRRVALRGVRVTVAGGTHRTLKLSLPAALRQLLARRRAFALALSATVTDPAGHRRTVKATVTVRP
jgi:DNA-binding beta-propeller fold protein YncE